LPFRRRGFLVGAGVCAARLRLHHLLQHWPYKVRVDGRVHHTPFLKALRTMHVSTVKCSLKCSLQYRVNCRWEYRVC
jgi:hypothetical protein